MIRWLRRRREKRELARQEREQDIERYRKRQDMILELERMKVENRAKELELQEKRLEKRIGKE